MILLKIYVAAYETLSQIIWNALLHNVYHRLEHYITYETLMADEQESL